MDNLQSWGDLLEETDVSAIADTFLETRDISPQIKHSLLHETNIDSIQLDTYTITLTEITTKYAEYSLGLNEAVFLYR